MCYTGRVEAKFDWYICGKCKEKINHPRVLTFTQTGVLHLKDGGECSKTQDVPTKAQLPTAELERDVQTTLEHIESDKAGDKRTSKIGDQTVTDTKNAWSHRTNNPNAFKKRS